MSGKLTLKFRMTINGEVPPNPMTIYMINNTIWMMQKRVFFSALFRIPTFDRWGEALEEVYRVLN